MKKSKWPIVFKLPLQGGWFYEVHVFSTRPKMWEYRKSLSRHEGFLRMKKNSGYNALVSTNSYDHGKRFGVILFTKWSAQLSGAVAHELTHAATMWWEATRRTRDIFKRHDEEFARVMEHLTGHYWAGWWKKFRGPFPKNSVEVRP